MHQQFSNKSCSHDVIAACNFFWLYSVIKWNWNKVIVLLMGCCVHLPFSFWSDNLCTDTAVSLSASVLRLSQGTTVQYFTQKLWTTHQNNLDASTLPRSLETDDLNSGISFKIVWSSMEEWIRFFLLLFAYKEAFSKLMKPKCPNSLKQSLTSAFSPHLQKSAAGRERVLISMSSYQFKFQCTEELKSILQLIQKFSCQVCGDPCYNILVVFFFDSYPQYLKASSLSPSV